MPDGGTGRDVGPPPTPIAARPGPYERASLIAHYLRANKPRAKLLVLDAKDVFSKQRLFQQAGWAASVSRAYPGVGFPISDGGNVTGVDPATP